VDSYNLYSYHGITKWNTHLKEINVGQAWQTDSLQNVMMQPAPIYKVLLTFWNTATDMLVVHLQHFCLSKTCLPLAVFPILKLYIHVCVCVCVCVCTVVNMKVTLIHSQCSNQQKARPDRSQVTLPKKYDFIYSSCTFFD